MALEIQFVDIDMYMYTGHLSEGKQRKRKDADVQWLVLYHEHTLSFLNYVQDMTLNHLQVGLSHLSLWGVISYCTWGFCGFHTPFSVFQPLWIGVWGGKRGAIIIFRVIVLYGLWAFLSVFCELPISDTAVMDMNSLSIPKLSCLLHYLEQESICA